jgi:hypothetical protein
MTRDEWKNYKDFDELSREMAGGFAANNLFGAGMTHRDAGSLLNPKALKKPPGGTLGGTPDGTPDGTPRAE